MIMKKTILLLAAVAAMVSCQREQDFRPDAPDSSPAITSALPSTLTATIEQGISKAGFEYDAAGKTYSHFWNDGDLIAYFAGDDRPNLYECTDAQNGGFALSKASKLTTTRATYAKNYAIYPDDVLIGATYDYYAYDEELVELEEMTYGAGYPISTTDPPVINVVVPKIDRLKYGDVTYGYGNHLFERIHIVTAVICVFGLQRPDNAKACHYGKYRTSHKRKYRKTLRNLHLPCAKSIPWYSALPAPPREQKSSPVHLLPLRRKCRKI